MFRDEVFLTFSCFISLYTTGRLTYIDVVFVFLSVSIVGITTMFMVAQGSGVALYRIPITTKNRVQIREINGMLYKFLKIV